MLLQGHIFKIEMKYKIGKLFRKSKGKCPWHSHTHTITQNFFYTL